MSTTITTTTTTTYTTNNDPTYVGTITLRGGDGPEHCDIGHGNQRPGDKGKLSDAIDDLALPSWLKDFVKSSMGVDGGANLPSEASAAKTINNFQKEHDIGLLSIDQVRQMAETGYCKGKDGKTFQVPEEVQLAAQKMMANNADLFKKLESATNGKHDGQLGQGDYGNAVKDGTISPNGGTDGGSRPRGLSQDDFMSAIMKGCIPTTRPSEYGAAKEIADFQKQHDIGLLSVEQLQMMAETGYCKDKDGNRFQVPEEVQGAAQKMLENDGELFKKLESAVTGKHDGLLSTKDFDTALEDGSIGKDSGTETVHTPITYGGPDAPGGSQQITITLGGPEGTGEDGTGLPSDSSAAKTIDAFQKQHDIGLLSVEQMQKMADTGYCTKDGKTFQVPEEVQNAAKQMMANDGELFKKMESAVTGKHDGLLSRGDYKAAIEDGTISRNPGTGGTGSGEGPTVSEAAKQITDFLKESGAGLMSLDAVRRMADSGYVKMPPFGEMVQVPPELQEAAKKLMENNAEGFKQLESGVTGKHDGLIGTGDFDAAVKDGTFTA